VLTALHEQAVIPVADPEAFGAVRSAIETAFSAARVGDFLKSVGRAGLRKGLLGPAIAAQYDTLGNGDQGQIREFYLASLEKVAPELRTKFLKLYAYY
jgi:hypothetical protein